MRPPALDLQSGDEHVLRLTSTTRTTVLDTIDGVDTRAPFLGVLRGFHRLRSGAMSGCSWHNCDRCDRGWRRHIRFELRVLFEAPGGLLEERRVYLSPRVAGQFAKIAERIDAQGKDPADVRILWAYRPGTTRVQEAVLLDSDDSDDAPRKRGRATFP